MTSKIFIFRPNRYIYARSTGCGFEQISVDRLLIRQCCCYRGCNYFCQLCRCGRHVQSWLCYSACYHPCLLMRKKIRLLSCSCCFEQPFGAILRRRPTCSLVDLEFENLWCAILITVFISEGCMSAIFRYHVINSGITLTQRSPEVEQGQLLASNAYISCLSCATKIPTIRVL